MTRRSLNRNLRKWHKWLGVIFGIQFLFWTIGGLYFSWTNIDHIRGDDLRKKEPVASLEKCKVPLATALYTVQQNMPGAMVHSTHIATVLDSVYYQLMMGHGTMEHHVLVNGETGTIRNPLTETEAIAVAKSRLKDPASAEVKKVTYLTKTNGHHEYREKPLPAYAVELGGKANTTVYVAAELGTVQSFRNSSWRIFDFLWMLHTMDYKNRDDINNWPLRIVSACGLLSLLSGFVLFGATWRRRKKM